MSNTNFTTMGQDGIVPIANPNGLFHIWALSEIYMGTTGANKYIPNLHDRVIDLNTNDWYSVDAVDPTVFTSTLTPIRVVPEGTFTDTDLLLGVGPGTQSDTYRVYINKSVIPYTLCVDSRLMVAGSDAYSCTIFRGSQLNGTAVAISAIYDQSGNLLGQSIPLELVANNILNNLAIKTVPVCFTMADVPDGEVVTAVFYSANGIVVSKRQLLVENTAFIKGINESTKYIIGITLESPFLSQSDNKLIQYPINVPLDGLMLVGVVTYSDGTQLRLPVDGTRFSIFGFSGYIATVVGQKFNLVLKYTLAPNEIVYGSQSIGTQVGNNFITNTYKATTLNTNGAFSVKLYAYPIWIDATNGYRLEWFMQTLDRNILYNVTPYVGYNTNLPVFNPIGYGINQTLSVYLDMQDVNASFTPYRNIQTINVTLVAPGTFRNTNWTIGFAPNQNPQFGVNNYATSTMVENPIGTIPATTWQVNITSGSTTLSEWLNNLYFNTLPLTDPVIELVPPTPNMFSLLINGVDVEFTIDNWDKALTVPGAVPDNSTLFIKFFLRLPNNDIILSVSALPVYQI